MAIVNESQFNFRLLLRIIVPVRLKVKDLFVREIPVWKSKHLNHFIANCIQKEMGSLNF